MFNFRADSSETIYGVLIEISSGSVDVAIVESHPENNFPTLIYSHRNTIRITKSGAEKTENIRRIKEALFSASLLLSQDGLSTLTAHNRDAKISKLYVTCSAPWAHTVARDVYYENDEPFKITPAILNDLIGSAETEIISELEQDGALEEDSFTIVERATVDIAINDYPVQNPMKLKGKTLGLSHVVGLVPESILTGIVEIQDKLFPQTILNTHTHMLVMYCVLRDIFPETNSICIIDITGEATEFAVVEDNVLSLNTSIPLGINTFVRMVMEKTGKPVSDIQSYMNTTDEKDHLDDSDFLVHKEEFTSQITTALTSILEKRTLPKDIIVLAHKPYNTFFTPLILDAFKKAHVSKPRVLKIKHDIINEVAGDEDPDIYLALGARFFHKLHHCTELEKED